MLGGALGSAGRYGLSLLAAALFGLAWPIGTLLANILGSGVMGLLMAFFNMAEPVAWGGELRAFLLVGLLGGFTTFSSFSIESVGLLMNGQFFAALSYILLSLFLCLSVAWATFQVGNMIFAR